MNWPTICRNASSGHVSPHSKNACAKPGSKGNWPPNADLDVALDLIYGPVYHRLVFHLGMPDLERLETLIAHARRAFDPPQSTR
jgi:hypothetical protein